MWHLEGFVDLPDAHRDILESRFPEHRMYCGMGCIDTRDLADLGGTQFHVGLLRFDHSVPDFIAFRSVLSFCRPRAFRGQHFRVALDLGVFGVGHSESVVMLCLQETVAKGTDVRVGISEFLSDIPQRGAFLIGTPIFKAEPLQNEGSFPLGQGYLF
ncbi:hypothetical protein AR505_0665 [methanogenic archaeon ISO4-H5]|nr:hypothetical protein AR505_0665 [methanogenic archaeon ISO4-H5]